MHTSLLDDGLFDEQLPRRIQHHASVHFTPVEVARCAARLLTVRDGARVLDVGSGAGKFCLVAAREVPTATFVGVELRAHLVAVAEQLATEHKLANATFVHADAFDLDWSCFDAFYLFNPFAEQRHPLVFVMDRTIELAPANFDQYVLEVQRRLALAALGTRVVTYHGFGAPLPDSYEQVSSFMLCTGMLETWVQTAGGSR